MLRTLACIAALLAGTALFIALALFRTRLSDRGYVPFLLPLIPGFFYVMVELSFLSLSNGSLPGLFRFLGIIEGAVFACMGLSCALFYEAQYRFNRVSRKGPVPTFVFALLTAVNYGFLLLRELMPSGSNDWDRFLAISVYSVLLYAGTETLLIIRRGNLLPGSAWAGVLAAGLGLFYYPFIAVTDVFDLPIPLLVTSRPVRLQAYAVYYLAVCVVLLSFFLRSMRSLGSMPVSETPRPEAVGPALTRREEELARLLIRGAMNGEIAAEFGVSISTVKTHTRNLYRKMKVHSRGELTSIMSGGGF